MKVYVVCDLEGVAGVVDFKLQCMEEGRYYQQAIRIATGELNALVEGAIEGGATEVYAWPGHGAFPGGIDVELLRPECNLVMHAGDAGPVGFDGSFDAMFLCGFHAMAGADGVLSHSFYPLIENFWVNGVRMGEIGMNMMLFGELDVPCVFVSGDQAALDEAEALVPGIEGAVVKWGLEEKEKLGALSVRKAISLSPERAQNVIREAATRAMGRIGSMEPYRLERPYTVRVQYTEDKYAEHLFDLESIKKIDGRTLEQVADGASQIIF
ncbi:MAG TPA: M55 family metallopeptidase [Patescibacteria group bacterium]|nr:M55 family metallopeptidase [Patescibacteria group bacterium]